MEQLNYRAIRTRKIVGYILLAILFVIVSWTTFVGTRTLYPIVIYNGRTSLYSFPAGLTYLLPLLILYFVIISMYAKTIKQRYIFVKILGVILLVCSIFNLSAIVCCIVLLWDGKFFPGLINPAFPLDVILFNIIYLLGGIGSLLLNYIDRKYHLSTSVSDYPLSNKMMVGFGFFLPFATYFFGEFLYGFMFFHEFFLDSNWHWMIPHYVSFVLPTLYFALYMGVRIKRNPESKKRLAHYSLIFVYASSFVTFVWLYAGLIAQPYLIEESLQWEYELLLPLKIPGGIFVTTAMCVIIAISASVKLFDFKFKRKKHE